MKKLGAIRYLFARGEIPGLRRDGDDDLVRSRDARGVTAERRRGLRRTGALTSGQKRENARMRELGVQVFDRDAGLSELGGYLSRGRQR